MKNIYVITGGTMVHVAPHFSLCAPAYGTIGGQIINQLRSTKKSTDYRLNLICTKISASHSDLVSDSNYGEALKARQSELLNSIGLKSIETNDDLNKLVDYLISQESTRAIIMCAAVCDFEPLFISDYETKASGLPPYRGNLGKNSQRLKSNTDYELKIKPAPKIIDRIRKNRKDIFLVSFKTTSGETKEETYKAGLAGLKKTSSNIVFANDIKNKHNVIVTPEEFPYYATDRQAAIELLCKMLMARLELTFTRTNLIESNNILPYDLHDSKSIPLNFVPVLEWLVDNGAFHVFNGKTSGHFGCKVFDKPYVTISSCRKTNHNNVFIDGMCKIYGMRDGKIVAEGKRPSVGEHTQQRIYQELGDKVHSIVHFHCEFAYENLIPVRPQFEFECGSHQCAENTALGMEEIQNGIWAVHLEGHGPNIAFHKNIPAQIVIDCINKYWDLSKKSGGNL